jgi:hypothetical protein
MGRHSHHAVTLPNGVARRRSPRHAFVALVAVALSCAVGGALAGGFAADARAAASGQELWSQVIGDVTTTDGDEVLDVARGANDTVYMCGVYMRPSATGYLWVARYAANGNQIWLQKYGESLGIDANASAIAVDRWGNLIVAGRAESTGTGDILVLKYSAGGVLRWAQTLDGVGGGEDSAGDVAVDRAGGIYVACASTGMGTGQDYLVVKYGAGGGYKWECRYAGPGADDTPYAIAIDGERSTYVTGASPGTGGDRDIVTVKVDATGSRVWARRFDGSAHLDDFALDVACGAGAVYVTGTASQGVLNGDYVMLKYASAGTRRWAGTWDGPAHGGDSAERLAVDGHGDVWAVGSVASGAGYTFAAVVKWDAAGHRRWARLVRGSGVLASGFHDVTVDAAGTAWCTGALQPTMGPGDALVCRYTSGGRRLWLRRWNGPSGDYDGATALCLSGTTSLYLGGWTFVPGTGADAVLIRYRR